MSHRFLHRSSLLLIAVLLLHNSVLAQSSLRKRVSFNEGWLFHKTTDSAASQSQYKDLQWRKLSLPHDWAIEGPFKPEYNPRTGGLPPAQPSSAGGASTSMHQQKEK